MKVPVKVIVVVNLISVNLRLCYVPQEYGWSWFSFVGYPSFEINVEPILKSYNLSKIPRMADLIKSALDKKIKLLCYPNKKKYPYPSPKIPKPEFKFKREIRSTEIYYLAKEKS